MNGLSRDSTLWDIHKVLQDKTSIPPDRQKSIYRLCSNYSATLMQAPVGTFLHKSTYKFTSSSYIIRRVLNYLFWCCN